MKPSIQFEIENATKKELEQVWDEWAKDRIDVGLICQSKIDGVRVIFHKRDDKISCFDDDGNDVTKRYQERFNDLFTTKRNLILDTEMLFDEAYAISVLSLDNIDLRCAVEKDRMLLLKSLKGIHFSAIPTAMIQNKEQFLDVAKAFLQNTPEGIMLKEMNSTYGKAETNSWAKVKKVMKLSAKVKSRTAVGKQRWTYQVTHPDWGSMGTQPTGIDAQVGDSLNISIPFTRTKTPRVIGLR